jgi:hypothetical protein
LFDLRHKILWKNWCATIDKKISDKEKAKKKKVADA